MKEIVQLILAENAGPNDTNQMILLEPKNSIIIPGIPSYYSFSVSALCSGIDFLQINYISVSILDMTKSEAIFFMEFPHITVPFDGKKSNNNINVHLNNVMFKNEGVHKVIFKIGDKEYYQEFNVELQGVD
jgi:hypothetical protein